MTLTFFNIGVNKVTSNGSIVQTRNSVLEDVADKLDGGRKKRRLGMSVTNNTNKYYDKEYRRAVDTDCRRNLLIWAR